MNRLYLLLIMCVALLCPVRLHAGDIGFGLSAIMGDVTPDLVSTRDRTPLTVQVTNTGIGSPYRMEIEGDAGLNAVLITTDPISLQSGRSATYTVDVSPADPGSYSLRIAVYGEDPPDEVKVQERTFTVRAAAPPETFLILQPNQDAVLEGQFDIVWTPSPNAENYDIHLYEYAGADPVKPALLVFSNRTGTSFRYSTASLQKGKRYAVEIFAKNEIGVLNNAEGLRSFFVQAAPDASGFSVLQPQLDEKLTTTPRILWQPAANALKYRVTLFTESNGMPSPTPLRVVDDILTTSYDWSNPPLEPSRNYYVTVYAFGESGIPVQNVGGPIRFFASALGDFYLVYPAENENGINPKPEFRWQAASGAHGHTIFIYEETADGDELFHAAVTGTDAVVVRYRLPEGRPLRPDTVYRWVVVAFRTDAAGNVTELRETADSDRFFRTTRMSEFMIRYPWSEAVGVPQVPTFRWDPTTGGLNYFVEVTRPMSNGKPNEATILQSRPIPANEWVSEFPPLLLGGNYFWRVWGFDGKTAVFNLGGWQKFQVTKLAPFNLLAPADDTSDTSMTLTLEWEPVANAQGYAVHLSIPGRRVYEPLLVDATVPAVTLPREHLKLNSKTDYEWHVEAFAQDGADTRVSNETWTFGTGFRGLGDPPLGACDVLEHLIGQQLLSATDRVYYDGLLNPVLDASAYIRVAKDRGECP